MTAKAKNNFPHWLWKPLWISSRKTRRNRASKGFAGHAAFLGSARKPACARKKV
jgi:hypothetical protein